MTLTPKNWHTFQHYTKRTPPWVKLHRTLLDDCEFQRMPDASRALAPMLWLLSSESCDGVIAANLDALAYRLRKTERWLSFALIPLINNGLFLADSTMLADCKRHATVETETEAETEAETLLGMGYPRGADSTLAPWETE